MSQFENGSHYNQSKSNVPNIDFSNQTDSYISSNVEYHNDLDPGEIDFDTINPIQGDDSDESSEEETVWYHADYPNEEDPTLEEEKSGKQLLEDNRIYIDSDVEQIYLGQTTDEYVFLTRDFEILIKDDGTVTVETMNISNVKRAHVSSIGIHFETSEGTWTITNDGKTTFFGTDGKYYVTENNLYKMLKFFDVTGTKFFDLSELHINDDGSLTYTDSQAKATYEFDSTGRITSFIQGDVKVEYDYNPTEEDYEYIRSMDEELYKDADFNVNFVATSTIRGHEMKYYSIGEEEDMSINHYPIGASLAYSNYSEKILSMLDDCKFKGTIIGPWELSIYANDENKPGAYVSRNLYQTHIFVPSNKCKYLDDFYKTTVPLHEMGHIVFDEYRSRFAHDGTELGNHRDCFNVEAGVMFQHYKELVESLKYSGYSNLPNYNECFADASSNYILDPEELKRCCPELYEFLEMVYGEEEYYYEIGINSKVGE